MEEKGFSTNEELAAYLGISHVSVAKRIRAARIDETLISLFPDYEGIPNSIIVACLVYRNMCKNLFPLDEVIDNVKEETKDLDIGDLGCSKVVMEKSHNLWKVFVKNLFHKMGNK